MSVESIESKVIRKIKKRGRGNLFFPSNFVSYGEIKNIHKILERLTNENMLLRISRGIYYYPKVDKQLGLGVLYPTLESVAEGIASHDKARIVPTGLYALNRLGFSTQITMNIVYLTDGYPRKVTLWNDATIQFKHTQPKNLSFHSHLAMLLTFAFKSLGKENVTDDILIKTKALLAKDSADIVKQDYALMPSWVSSMIKKLYEE